MQGACGTVGTLRSRCTQRSCTEDLDARRLRQDRDVAIARKRAPTIAGRCGQSYAHSVNPSRSYSTVNDGRAFIRAM